MSFARHLRNNATPEERALWRELSRLRPRFTRQLSIGPFVADFACRRARVVVELDGSAQGIAEAIAHAVQARLPEQERVAHVGPCAGRERRSGMRSEEPPPAPPHGREGEQVRG